MNREERIYSVTMTEDELRLFSEFLEQKEYAASRGPKMPKRRPTVSKSQVVARNAKTIEKDMKKGISPLTPSRHDLDMRDAAGLSLPWD